MGSDRLHSVRKRTVRCGSDIEQQAGGPGVSSNTWECTGASKEHICRPKLYALLSRAPLPRGESTAKTDGLGLARARDVLAMANRDSRPINRGRGEKKQMTLDNNQSKPKRNRSRRTFA